MMPRHQPDPLEGLTSTLFDRHETDDTVMVCIACGHHMNRDRIVAQGEHARRCMRIR